MEVLGKLEETCEAVAAFWTMEADRFASQGAKMKTGQATMLKSKSKTMRSKAIENNIQFWTKAKDEMDRYVTAMSVINNSFNFQTEAKPPRAQSFGFKELEFSLSLPASINVKAITDGK